MTVFLCSLAITAQGEQTLQRMFVMKSAEMGRWSQLKTVMTAQTMESVAKQDAKQVQSQHGIVLEETEQSQPSVSQSVGMALWSETKPAMTEIRMTTMDVALTADQS